MSRKLVLALIIALVAALMLSGIAYAITIVVDGVREAAWDGSGGQVPGSITDGNEPGITDGYDISRIQWTNDGTNFYFLVETYANSILSGNPIPTVVICLNTDSLPSGGSYANCNGMTGIDRSIVLTRFGVQIYDGDPNAGTIINTPTAAQTAANITEASISLSGLGFSAGNCPATIPYAVYFDNGIVDADDNVPDNGILTLSCGGPTAVELSSLQARPTSSPVLPVALVGVSAAALIGIVFLTRRGRKKAV
jgi:hypothetical protein